MNIFVIILSFFIFTGLLFYFRFIDSRNLSVRQMKDYLKQAERHIETILKQKEKEFNDKIIASEIATERLNRLANSLQTQVDAFDEDLESGEKLLENLRSEIQGVAQELNEYKKIRSDFANIEEKIVLISNMKQHALEGSQELEMLRGKMNTFEKDYQILVSGLQETSKNQLTDFYNNMQNDLDQYLAKSRAKLEQKDTEMEEHIQELKDTSFNFKQQLMSFQEVASNGLDHLRQKYESDIDMAQTIANNSIQNIYDMWETLKEKTQSDKTALEDELLQKERFFQEAEEKLRDDLRVFGAQVSLLAQEHQGTFQDIIDHKTQEFEQKISGSMQDLDLHSEEIRQSLETKLNQKTSNIEEELSRVYTAFVEQENSIEERIKQMRVKLTENIEFAEQQFKNNLEELQHTVHTAKDYADNLLEHSQLKINEKVEEFELGFKQKLDENMEKIEESFRKDSQNRILQSIQEVTENLELEYRNQHQATVQHISKEIQDLDESLQQKKDQIETMAKEVQEVISVFDREKDNIITMTADLHRDREQNLAVMKEEMLQHMQMLNSEVQNYMDKMFSDGQEVIAHENQMWQERYVEIVQEAREAFSRIERDIKTIHHMLDEVKDNTLGRLKDEAERFQADSQRKLEDLKQDTSNHMRNCKDDFYHQLEDAKAEVKNLRDELWKQEKEIRDSAQKDFDRLTVRVKEMEKQFQNLFRKTERLDKTDNLITKLNSDFNDMVTFKKEMQLFMSELKQYHFTNEDQLKQIQIAREDLTTRLSDLAQYVNEAGNVGNYLEKSVEEARNTVDLFNQLNTHKENAEVLENLLRQNLETYNDLIESLDVLNNRKVIVDQLMTDIEKADQAMSHIQEMAVLAQNVQEQMGGLQSEMRDLAGDQTKIYKAVSRFNELDHMILDIEQEEKRLQKMMDWIAKAMNNMERMNVNAKSPDSEDENVKNILRLYKQNWNINDIAKNLNLSPAYVDLMIDRYK